MAKRPGGLRRGIPPCSEWSVRGDRSPRGYQRSDLALNEVGLLLLPRWPTSNLLRFSPRSFLEAAGRRRTDYAWCARRPQAVRTSSATPRTRELGKHRDHVVPL